MPTSKTTIANAKSGDSLLIFRAGSHMRAFSGTILGPEPDVALPTVAQIEGDTLILSTSEGAVAEWPLDRVRIIEIGNGYFEVVADDRKLSLVLDEPEAFEKALEDERALRVGISYIWTGSQEEAEARSEEHTSELQSH